MKKRKKRRPPNSPSLLKEKAVKAHSIYIRTKDADSNGNATCVTCGEVDHWKNLQAGHFVPSRCNAVLFEKNNCHVQCYTCNIHKAGNLIEYYPYMLKRYGEEEVDRLRALRHKTVKFSLQELEDMIELFTRLSVTGD